MNKQDIEKLASDAWEKVGGLSLYAGINDRDDAFHRIFAALVLEEAARHIAEMPLDHPGRADRTADQCADEIRTIAEGLKP